ncbi:MAG: hypothetical protein A7316_05700 [Candidatus Altiarchaeales archaeon WOR_SM1_86-2]|nr:MAG: hypothetical protein A7316_05700 [Candidatus Altiarchaeales archaeon WOR_SM1_86-2]
MIRINNLFKDLGDFSLENIDLEIQEGEYFVLLGPTGSGKTVLIECIAGLHNPKVGQIWINGRDATMLTPEERGVSYVPQDYALFPFLTVKENIEFGMKIKKYSKAEIDQRLKEMLDLLEIENLLHRDPSTLSGGEGQRVAIARALAVKPTLLLLDEPLSALDPKTQQALWIELKRIHRELKVTTIHVTHNFEEAISLGDRIGVMNKGEIVQIGPPDEVFRKPKSRIVAEFVGADNLFKGTSKIGDEVSMVRINGMITDISTTTKKEGSTYISIRPEDIVLSKDVCKCYADMNMLKGRITEALDKGILIKAVVDVGIPLSVLLTRRAYLEKELSEGDEVYVIFKSMDVHLF